MADGKPMLKGWAITHAAYGNGILAALCHSSGQSKERVLRVFGGPEGKPIFERRSAKPGCGFQLSSDGKLLAVLSANGRSLLVHDVTRDCAIIYGTPKSRWHPSLTAQLGHEWLIARIGFLNHLFRWDQEALVHTSWQSPALQFGPPQGSGLKLGGMSCTEHRMQVVEDYDTKRWVRGLEGELQVVVDCFGHIAILDRMNELVCMLRVFRQQFAAWMPDGTRYGPPKFSGGPQTPLALEKIGQALRKASSSGREKSLP
jgi:hypothetical protein